MKEHLDYLQHGIRWALELATQEFDGDLTQLRQEANAMGLKA